MNKFLVIGLLTLMYFSKALAGEPKAYKMPNTQVISIAGFESEKQYELYIKLPQSYSENIEKKYPVIYFTDAVWHIELLSAATEFLLEDAILVGISWQTNISEDLKQQYGAHASRFSDYSFWKTGNPKHPKLKFGQADGHLDFVRKKVIPYVETQYRTDTANRSYFGYSLGGLFGAYTLMTQPDTFKNYILGSPSVKLLTKDHQKIKGPGNIPVANVFISNGEQEPKLGKQIETFLTLLKSDGNKNVSVKHAVIKGSHQTAFPATGVQSISWLSGILENKN